MIARFDAGFRVVVLPVVEFGGVGEDGNVGGGGFGGGHCLRVWGGGGALRWRRGRMLMRWRGNLSRKAEKSVTLNSIVTFVFSYTLLYRFIIRMRL